ncbi:hypothetical protein SAMN05216480_10314 [Pustulibacterium marinum]|uniref:Uncharacterized protein n=1 Tax=Pustulibacterium marinum TaxID=1224947 RepID=A0A1I7G0F9_9FLAO|nr:hypothetical protein SAMN05216480_10314 [Pustulibacterium marinum]
MNKQFLYLAAMALCIAGCTIAGLSLGILYSEVWVGILLGLGIGLLIAALLLLRKTKETAM